MYWKLTWHYKPREVLAENHATAKTYLTIMTPPCIWLNWLNFILISFFRHTVLISIASHISPMVTREVLAESHATTTTSPLQHPLYLVKIDSIAYHFLYTVSISIGSLPLHISPKATREVQAETHATNKTSPSRYPISIWLKFTQSLIHIIFYNSQCYSQLHHYHRTCHQRQPRSPGRKPCNS